MRKKLWLLKIIYIYKLKIDISDSLFIINSRSYFPVTQCTLQLPCFPIFFQKIIIKGFQCHLMRKVIGNTLTVTKRISRNLYNKALHSDIHIYLIKLLAHIYYICQLTYRLQNRLQKIRFFVFQKSIFSSKLKKKFPGQLWAQYSIFEEKNSKFDFFIPRATPGFKNQFKMKNGMGGSQYIKTANL